MTKLPQVLAMAIIDMAIVVVAVVFHEKWYFVPRNFDMKNQSLIEEIR
jgi:hypothetical protein